MQPYPRSPDLVWPGHLHGTGCLSARAVGTGFPTVGLRLWLGPGCGWSWVLLTPARRGWGLGWVCLGSVCGVVPLLPAVCGVRGWALVSACFRVVCGFVRFSLAPHRFRFRCAVWACVLGPVLGCAPPFLAGLSGCVFCAFLFVCFFFRLLGLSVPGLVLSPPVSFLSGWAAGFFFFFLVCVCLFRFPFSRWAAVPGLVLPVLAGWSPCAWLGFLSLVPSGWVVWPPSVSLAGGLLVVGCFPAPPDPSPPFFFFRGGAAWPFLPLPTLGWRLLSGWCVVWLVPRHSWRWFLCATPRHSWLGFATAGGGRSPPLLAGVRWRRWCVVCGVWRWCVGGVVAGVWCGWSLATPGGGSCVLLPATPGWVSLPVVVGGPRHSWLGSVGGVAVWCVAVVCWWGCGWCVVWLVPRHSWRRFLCATPRHSWLGFAAGGGGGSLPLLAGVRWRRCCVVCAVWRWCVGGVVAGVWCGWSLATPGGGSCVLLPATPGWVSLPVVVGGPRHSWLGSVGGVAVWCVLCGGGVLVGLWLVCGVVGPLPLLAEVPVCYSPPLLAGFRCRWWWAVPATPGWGPLAALLCGVCCVAVVCWWGCGWCVVWLVPRHSWRRFLCATPRHSWLGFAAGGGGRSPPLLAGVRLRRWCVAVACWWGCGWCVVWLVPRHSWRRFLCATPRHSCLGFAAGGGGRSPPLLAGLCWRRWCVVCGVLVCGGGVVLGWWLVCGVVGPSPLLAEIPVCYSPPLLAGFRCRWCWAVPATPGWGPLAAVVCGVWCVGVWRRCGVGVVAGVWCGWSLATPGGGSCVLLPATPGWVSLPLVVGGPRHSWLGSAGGGGVWCVVIGGGVVLGLWLAFGVVGPSPLLAEVPVCYSPPLLAGFRCRWWWAVPATPGWGPLAAVVCGVWCVVCGVLVGSLATPGGGSCVLLPATPGWVLLPLVVGGPRHSWLGSAGGGGVWCVAVVCWWGCGRALVHPDGGWCACVFVCVLCLAGSGGPASRARSGAPHLFLWPLCLAALLGPLRAGVAPLSFAAVAVPRWLFFSASRCLALRALAPRLCLPLGRWLLSGGCSPAPLPFCASRFLSLLLGALVVFFFSPSSSSSVRPPCLRLSLVSGPGCPGPRRLRCLLCWPSASRLSVRLSLFCAFRLAVGCSLVVAAPPPPFWSRGFRRSCLVPWCFFFFSVGVKQA